ncbi:MAG: hypothetical protein Q8936_10695 [Bacillota bacterium]|nr:hypothetical protein [Bacillota bacterium]
MGIIAVPVMFLLTVGVIFLQIFLSKKQDKWLVLILPIIMFALSLFNAANMRGTGNLLTNILSIIAALILSNIPTIILLSIYFSYMKNKKAKDQLNKLKAGIVIIVGILIIYSADVYVNYIKLDVYTVQPSGDIVSKDGIVYKFDGKLTSDYMSGDLKGEKMIGKVNGDGFLGRRIYKLRGIDTKNSISLNGLMLQQVNTTENNSMEKIY